jgi:hypothetical protein
MFEGMKARDLTGELSGLKEELESVLSKVCAQANDVVQRVLNIGLDGRKISLASVCQRWTKCFCLPDLQRAGGAQAVAFITRLEQQYDNDELLLDSLASQLIGQPVARWSDGSLVDFERALSETIRSVEDEAVRLATSGNANDVIKNNLSRLIEARIQGLYENLRLLTGQSQASASLRRVIESPKQRNHHGDNSRSAG